MNKRLQIATINRTIQYVLPGVELVKGTDYFYFAGPGTDQWQATIVLANKVSDLTLTEWMDEALTLSKDCR